MNKKAIIFDMDGTLFDTEKISFEAWYSIRDHFHLPVNDEFILSLCGRTRQSAQGMYKKYMPEDFDEDAVYAYRHDFMVDYKKKYGPLPKCDLKKLFDELKKKGYKLAICSSSSQEEIELNLNYVNVLSYFDIIVNGKMTSKGKPAPDIYLKTAELLKLDPSECIVVEDSASGIISGSDAGMEVIMVIDLIQPTLDIQKRCSHIFEHLEDILNVL